MIRFFISLYLAVVLGLLAINWGTEWLWQQLNQQQSNEITTKLLLSKALPNLIAGDRNKIKQFQSDTGFNLKQLALDDIAWLEQQKHALNKGEAIVSFNQNQQAIIYIQDLQHNLIYQLGPLPARTEQNSQLKYALLICSYFLLAAFLALWTQPIWRDLLQLKYLAEQISAGKLTVSTQINKSSPTAIVVETFQSMASRITRLLSEQSQLVNAVSHELRTPLSRLHFSLAILKSTNPKQTEEISKDLHEMESLVDEMLSYARIETLEQKQNKSNVNISELLHNLVEKHQRSTDKKLNLKLNDKDKKDKALHFFCNGHLLERACQNLLTNGIRYAKQQVQITAKLQQGKLTIMVADDGIGIDVSDHTKVFNAFTRLDKSRDKSQDNHQSGFGLGLAIVKRIIDWHQGQCIVVKSPLGGAQFTITI